MPKTRCPHCKWTGDVEEEHIDQLTDCPACGEEFTIQALKKKKKSLSVAHTGVPARNAPTAPVAPQAASGCGGRLLRWGLSALAGIVALALIGAFFYVRTDKENKKREAIIMEVGAEFAAGKHVGAYQALARDLAVRAIQGTGTEDLRGRRTGFHDLDQFRENLRTAMRRATDGMSTDVHHDWIYSDTWRVYRHIPGGQSYSKYDFQDDGTATRTLYNDYALQDAYEQKAMKVIIDGSEFAWHYDGKIDKDLVILFSRRVFILDELDGHYTCWHNTVY